MKTIRLTGIFLFLPVLMYAQVSWYGIYDLEVLKGGRESSLDRNELPNGHIQLRVHQFQLFLEAALSERVSVSTKFANSAANGFTLRGLDVQLAYVTFNKLWGDGLNVSAGKILTPFGSYARRQLSPENPLIGHPLFFQYQTNVSATTGYLDSTSSLLARSLYGGRLSTIYRGGYYVGIEAYGSFLNDFLLYDLAMMNAPLSSLNSDLNLDKELAFHGRLAVHPAIWGTFGISYSSGSFLEKHISNAFLDKQEGTEQFSQRTFGLDLNLNYLYYDVNIEYIVNRFIAPHIILDYSISPPYKSSLAKGESLHLRSYELLFDVKVDAPFYPGLFLAARFNPVRFSTIKNPDKTSSTFARSIPWESNIQRYAVALGYKPELGILIKVGYEATLIDVKPRPDVSVYGAQVSISF